MFGVQKISWYKIIPWHKKWLNLKNGFVTNSISNLKITQSLGTKGQILAIR